MNLAQRLSAYAAGLRFEDLPSETVHEAKRRWIDTLGCALGALHSEPAQISRRLALTQQGTPGATVIGTTHQAPPETAAFANGVLFRYLDYNDTYLSKEPAHPSDNLAAVLAIAEPRGASGREVLTATVLAYEVQCRLCDAASIRARGWDHVTYGSFSTALAAGKLLGLDATQLTHALGLAGVPNNALRQTRVGMLSHWKGCAFANASRNGVFAALLASYGMTGPSDVFEGQMGFWKQVSGPFDLPMLGGNGVPFMIHQTCIKFWPAEYHSQSAIDAALQLRAELPDVAAIERITVETFHAAVEIIGHEPEKWRPTTRETADHSLPYCIAVALMDGRVTLDSFDAAHLGNEALMALIQRIEVRADDALNRRYPEGIPNRLRVHLKDGTVREKEVTYPRGHARNPMTDAEVEDKFRAMADGVLPPERIAEVLDRCWHLEQQAEVGTLLRLLAVL
ncbi:MAG: MmgE/PrpD family protein [Chloroherpetonaceae bacterium]|nr:MmgE/PrpD family protein [Chthonomonadaceae bacterium]MDW8207020.1 MmgE/PrpD family protein [Chloroherpetonaceae bacterium]